MTVRTPSSSIKHCENTVSPSICSRSPAAEFEREEVQDKNIMNEGKSLLLCCMKYMKLELGRALESVHGWS